MIERTDFYSLADERLAEFIVSPPSDAFRWGIRTTSGTTGKGPLLVVNHYRPGVFVRYEGYARILLCFGPLNVRLAHALHVNHHTDAFARKILCLDGRDMSLESRDLLNDFAPDGIAGFPSFIVRVAGLLSTEAAARVRAVNLTGERLTANVESLLRKQFPRALFTTTYMSTEIGQIGTSCEQRTSLNEYHPIADVSVRLKESDEEGKGEILVSKKLYGTFSVEDYRIGDTVRMVPGSCPCGAAVIFEHLGRSGFDYLKLAGAMVQREELDRVALLFPFFVNDYRVEGSEILESGTLKGKLVLLIFSSVGIPTQGLQEELTRDFSKHLYLTPTQTLANLVAKGLFVPLTIEFSDTPFSQKNKDVKLKLVSF